MSVPALMSDFVMYVALLSLPAAVFVCWCVSVALWGLWLVVEAVAALAAWAVVAALRAPSGVGLRLLPVLAVVVMALSATAPASAEEWGGGQTAAEHHQELGKTLLECSADGEENDKAKCRQAVEDASAILDTGQRFLVREYVALLRITEYVGEKAAPGLEAGMMMVGPVVFAIFLAVVVGRIMLSPVADAGESIRKAQPQIVWGFFWLIMAVAITAKGAFNVYWDWVVWPLFAFAAGIADQLIGVVFEALGAPAPTGCAASATTVTEIGGCTVGTASAIWEIGLGVFGFVIDNTSIWQGNKFFVALIFLLAMAVFSFMAFWKLLDRLLQVLFSAILAPVLVWVLPYQRGRQIGLYLIGFAAQAALHFVVLATLVTLMSSLILAEYAADLDPEAFGFWPFSGGVGIPTMAKMTFVAGLGIMSLRKVDSFVDKITEPLVGSASGDSISGAISKTIGMAVGVAGSRPALAAMKAGMGALK